MAIWAALTQSQLPKMDFYLANIYAGIVPKRVIKKEDDMSIIVEIRAAEGGMDAKGLVEKQFSMYVKYCRLHCL